MRSHERGDGRVSGNQLVHLTRGWHFRLLGLGRFETFDFPVKDENY